MSFLASRAPLQVFRIASLLVPPAIAWHFAWEGTDPTSLTRAVTFALGPLWLAFTLALAFRGVRAVLRHRRAGAGAGELTLLDRLDVLTASGSALSWLAAGSLVAAVEAGWASLFVLGLLGLGVLYLVVAWTLWVTDGDDPWRVASLSRRFVPEHLVEGDEVTEEVRLTGPRIPIGFRLLARGRVGPRWATSRYVVDGTAADGEVVLTAEIGPALRGEHQAEPLLVWLQDVFGLCHSVRRRAGASELTVLPRPRAVRGADHLLGPGGGREEPRAARHAPTEGSLGLREYRPGDDARRIHWVRSQSAGHTVVRLPDEIPRDRPAVRLVLDTYLPEAEGLACPAPAELLDALVATWLGVGRALAEAGNRVTLVSAGPEGVEVASLHRTVAGRRVADRLGTRAGWQGRQPLDRLLTKEPALVVSYRLQPDPPGTGEIRWILAREWTWTRFDHHRPTPSNALQLPHALGSPDNRWSRRRSERVRLARAARDHATFAQLCGDTRRTRAATFVAMPADRGEIRLEVLS